MIKLLILLALFGIGLFLIWLDDLTEPKGSYLSLPGVYGILGLGFIFSTFITAIVFGILWLFN